MKPRPWKSLVCVLGMAIALAGAPSATAQSFSSGSTGADGPLSKTTTGITDIVVRPGGVYHHTTVNITAGTLNYLRGADNSPVVILATGDVTIGPSGVLSVNGINGVPAGGANPTIGASGGPGGFNGGNGNPPGGVPATAGHGPGGGAPLPANGTAPATYGAPSSFVALTPLFGGSGGGGGGGSFSGGSPTTGGSGGGGGGAILIASSTRIVVSGSIRANGGFSGGGGLFAINCGAGGSGGAIRLVAPEIVGSGNLQAIRGNTCSSALLPGDGRIRVEAFATQGFTGTTAPVASVSNVPGAVSPAGNPALENVPTLAIASVGGTPVPSTIAASYFTPDMALAPGTTNPVPVVIAATNTPVGGSTTIALRLIPQSPGSASIVSAGAGDHTGSFASSTATINATLPVGQVTVIQAIAGMTLTGQTASLFPQIDGEPVERVMVAASPGTASTLSLVTKSGKEARVDQLLPEQQLQVARAWQILKETHVE